MFMHEVLRTQITAAQSKDNPNRVAGGIDPPVATPHPSCGSTMGGSERAQGL